MFRLLIGWISVLRLEYEYRRRKTMDQKRNILMIIAALVLIASLSAVMCVNEVIEEQKQASELRIWELRQENEKLLAERYWNRLRRQIRFIHPIRSTWISSGMGYRKDPLGGVGDERLHKGIDIVDIPGTNVVAVMDGVVMEHWLVPGVHNGKLYHGHEIFGGFVVIKHTEELYSLYGHLGQTQVHEGQYINAGEKLGELGNTGLSTGPHLHFEVVVDPFVYLEGEL